MALGENAPAKDPKQGGNAAPHTQGVIGTGTSRVTKNAPSQVGDPDKGTHFGYRTNPVSGGAVKKSVPQEGI